MLVTLGWLLMVSLPHPTPTPVLIQQPQLRRQSNAAGRISVWTDREKPYQHGQRARIYFRADEPGYVTVLRVDTDGRLRTLFPVQPWGRAKVRGGQVQELSDSRSRGFTIDDDPGIGYLFAISSPLPFQYDDITRGDYWDFRVIEGGRIQGDPYVALTDLAARIAPRGDYQYDVSPYYVDRRYQYPRFVCYDCHSYASYDEWDPYSTSCARFRVVIYDDPAYYPYRYNSGRNVVMPSRRIAPKYVFKDLDPGTEYVTRERRRDRDRIEPSNERGRTSADVGGPGAIPTPGVPRPQPRARAESVAPAPLLHGNPSVEGRRSRPRAEEPSRLQPADREPRKVPPVQRGARNPQSTGEPELRRRKPDTVKPRHR
jgi:Domain of unknown function (DUF4384)